MRWSSMLGLAVVAALVAAPLGLPAFAMTLLTELVILGLFAMSLDLLVGYTRLVSFGHVAAYGLGAYASGYMLLNSSMPLPFVVILAALMTGVIAIGVGWVCTLATGVSFSMLTLAFAQLLYAIAFKWTSVTGGSDGLAGIPRRAGPMGMTLLTTKAGFYYFALACLVGSFLLCQRLVTSPFGAVLRGIRENEAKTVALGYNTRLYKIAVVAISYALGGLAGALYAPFAGFANTELLFWLLSGQVLIMVIVGGSGFADRTDPGRCLFPPPRAPALLLHRGVGAVFRPRLHRLRAVCPRGNMGSCHGLAETLREAFGRGPPAWLKPECARPRA